MDSDQELLSRLLTVPATDAWRALFGRAWSAFADAAPEKDGRSTLVERERALDPIELALVRFALARMPGKDAPLAHDDPDRIRIETALARLTTRLDLPPAPPSL